MGGTGSGRWRDFTCKKCGANDWWMSKAKCYLDCYKCIPPGNIKVIARITLDRWAFGGWDCSVCRNKRPRVIDDGKGSVLGLQCGVCHEEEWKPLEGKPVIIQYRDIGNPCKGFTLRCDNTEQMELPLEV